MVMTMKFLVIASILFLLPSFASAKDISERHIDQIVNNVMKVMKIPGISVGVIQNGKIIHAKGYGTRSLKLGGKVDKNTYFGIASNSKAFTATALGILVDEGKISWDDPVHDYLPDFAMFDAKAGKNFMIKDLLSHATGLPLGSGDLMWWPDANYSADEIIKKTRFLKPNREFRTSYEYNNIPFIIAGAIIPAVTGQTYEEFLQQRIFDPLHMDRCTANVPKMANDDNIAMPHAILEGKLKEIKRYLTIEQVPGSIAAAGIQCSVDDLLKWQLMHLNAGEINNGEALISKQSHAALWKMRTPMAVSAIQKSRDKTNYRGYGLGFNLNDYHGVKVISHGGALIGIYSHLTLVPELDFAVTILTNQQNGAAYNVIKNQILNFIMEIDNQNTAQEIYNSSIQTRKKEEKRLKNLKGNGLPAFDDSAYIGIYRDNWWGDVEISQQETGLYLTSQRSPSLRGKLQHFEANIFMVRWDDRNHEADAFVLFSANGQGEITSFKMKSISPRTDFSYDFHHVTLIKQ